MEMVLLTLQNIFFHPAQLDQLEIKSNKLYRSKVIAAPQTNED